MTYFYIYLAFFLGFFLGQVATNYIRDGGLPKKEKPLASDQANKSSHADQ